MLLEEEPKMLAERAKEWYEEARAKGIEQGIERGRAEERALSCRWAAWKFDPGTGARLSALLDRLTAPGQLGEVGDWVIECDTGADLLARVKRMFGYGKVRYRGLHKNVQRIALLLGLANLLIAERSLAA